MVDIIDPREQSLDAFIAGVAPVIPETVSTPKGDRPISEAEQLRRSIAQTQTAVSTPEGIASYTLSNERGNDQTAGNVIQQDWQTLNPNEFYSKYGADVFNRMAALTTGGDEVRRLAGASRDAGTHITDGLVDIGSAAVQGLNGANDFLLRGVLTGPLLDRALSGNAAWGKAAEEFANTLRSDAWQQRNKVAGMRAELDNADNQDQFKADKAKGSELEAALRSYGRGILSGANQLYEDPFLVEKGINNAVGSVLAAGPMTRGITSGAAAVERMIAARTGVSAASEVGSASFPLAIAAMEGGGNDVQTIQEVQDMPLSELEKQPAFQELVQSGFSPEEARTRLATRAGAVALSVSAPIAAATGKLVERFETNPFGSNTVRGMLGDAGREFTEEAIQSGVGQAAGNLGVRVSGADPDKNIAEDVGEQTVQGAVFGAGSAIAMQSPRQALRGAAKAVGATVSYPIGKLKERGERLLAEEEAASPVSSESLAPSVATAAETAPVVAEGLKTMAEENGATGEDVDSYVNKVVGASQLQESDLVSLPDQIGETLVARRDELGRMPNKFEVLAEAAMVANDSKANQQDRVDAASYILKSIEDNKKLFLEDVPEFLEKVSHDREEYQQFNDYARILQVIGQNPQIREALDWAVKKMQQPDVDLATIDMQSPQGQRIVTNTVNMAEVAPQAVNPNVAAQVLAQADEGTIELSPERRRMLRSAISLKDAARIYEAQMRAPEPGMLQDQADELQGELDETQFSDEQLDFVGRQIESEGGAKAHQLSMQQHVSGINQAIASGNPTLTRQRVQHLAMFARSQINKVKAMNQAIRNGDRKRVSYQSYGPDGWLKPDDYFSVFFNPGTESSIRTARKIHAEAMGLVRLANDYASQFPEFGIRPVDVPALALNNQVNINSDNQEVNQDNKRGSSTSTEAVEPSGATTPQVADDTDQMELPLPPSPPARETVTESSAEEDSVTVSTEPVKNTSSDPVEVIEPEAPVDVPVEPSVEPVTEPSGEDEQIIDAIDAVDENGPSDLSVSEVYPDLVQPSGSNFFHKAYVLPKKAVSRMGRLMRPMNNFYQMLGDSELMLQFMGGDRIGDRYDVTADDVGNYRRLLKDYAVPMLEHMNKRLSSVLSKVYDKKSGATVQDRIEQGDARILGNRDRLALNLVQKIGNKYGYNPELIQTAVIGSLDWVLNASSRAVPLDRQKLAELTGVSESEISDDHINEFNRGISLSQARRDLALNIEKFWGMRPDSNTPDNYVQGVREAVAAEILHAFEEVGLLSTGTVQAFGDKTFGRVWFDTRSEETQEFLNSLNGTSELLGDMALIDRERQGVSIGAPVNEVDGSQLSNPMVSATPMVKKALANAQKTAYLPNTLVHDFIQAIGRDRYVSLMSGRMYQHGDLNKTHTEVGLNKGHWASIQGRQRSFVNSFENVTAQMEAINAHAAAQGIPIEEVGSYYKHQWNKLGRIQQVGLSTPQADKNAREIFMATKSTLDLSVPGSDSYNRFMMTVGQGIADQTGVKPEKVTRFEVVAAVEKTAMAADGKLRPLLDALKEWSLRRENARNTTVSGDLLNLMVDAELSNHGIHSLLALAKYENARDRGQDLSHFETSNYLEADGKTNGPINALMIMASGAITSQWLKTVAKGGAFFGRQNKSLNSHYAEDAADLYQAGASTTEREIAALGAALHADSKEAGQHFDIFKRFLAALDTNVVMDSQTGEITIKRGLTKNPLTITIYGSGANGIAGKVVGELVSTIYEKMSESLQTQTPVGDLVYQDGQGSFIEDLAHLTSVTLAKGKNGYFLAGDPQGISGNPSDFQLTPKQFKALQENALRMLVTPMRNAIAQEVTQHVSGTTDAIQQATQIQSIILKGMFNQAYAARLALKQSDPEKYGYARGDVLSENEVNDILNNLKPYSPLIETGSQSYFLAGGEKAELFETTEIKIGDQTYKVHLPDSFAGSLTGDMRTPGLIYGATLAGVSSVPTLTVGSGDGQMQLNSLQDEEMTSRTTQVFDGTNMPADMIDEYSRRMNQSVFETWTKNGNPVRAAYESFAAFLRNDPVSQLFPEGEISDLQVQTISELSQSYFNKRNLDSGQRVSAEEARAYMETALDALKFAADDTDIRRKVYAEFPLSVDQMASAESPFTNPGSIELAADASYEDIAAAMEARRLELWNELRESRQEPTIERNSPEMLEEFASLGSIDESGARVIGAKEIGQIRFLKAFTPVQREMVLHASKVLADSGIRLVIGSNEQLDAWEQAYHPDVFQPNSAYLGKYVPVGNYITVSNVSAETLTHELVHASTFLTVNKAVSDPKSVNTETLEAVQRTEGLMSEWLDQDYSLDEQSAYQTAAHAQNIVREKLAQNEKAQAINEFMAWVLSNQTLADLASKAKVQNPLFRIVGDALKALKALIWGTRKGPRVGDTILSNLRFNTRVIMASRSAVENLQEDFDAVALFQSPVFGSNDRLSDIRQKLGQKLVAHLRGDGSPVGNVQRNARNNEAEAIQKDADDLTATFAYYFPDMSTMQQKSTFSMVLHALMADIELNPNALSRIEELYTHVIDKLDWSDFRLNDNPNDPNDEHQALEKYNALMGLYNSKTDKHGRSTLMSSFLALSMVSDQFRDVLSKIEKPKSEQNKEGTLDAWLENLGNAGMDRLSMTMSGEKSTDLNVQAALDRLMGAMIDNVGDQRAYIEQQAEGGLSKLDEYVAAQIQEKSEKVIEKSGEILRTSKSRTVKAGAALVNFAAHMINEQSAEQAALGLTSWMNRQKGLETVRALMNDVISRTKENAPIWDMISKVRAAVQQTRQQFREELPKKLASEFKKPVTAEQWTAMFRTLGKTDLASLVGPFGVSGALEMISSQARLNSEIQSLESAIRTAEPVRSVKIFEKSKQLANYLNTGEHGAELLRNAEAIARLLNVRGMVRLSNPDPQHVLNIDRLVSLYALQSLDQGTRDVVSDLIRNEPGGLNYVTNYLVGQRAEEMDKVKGNTVALFNHYKGAIPSEAQQGGSLIIASDSDQAKLILRGYKKIAPYTGSSADRSLGSRSYYFAPVSGTAPFSQGIMQTVHQTASGVDPQTGYTIGEIQGGRIEDPRIIQSVSNMLPHQTKTRENLLPVFDAAGKVVAYERAADVEKLSGLNRSTDLSKMLGVWRGRQAEEYLGLELNKELVDKTHAMWEEAQKTGRTKEFVNIGALGSKDDPVLVEAAKLIPNQSRDYIQSKFGRDNFWVRRDLLLDTFGTRQASVGDMFTGQTRFNPKIANEFALIATGALGKKAYPILVGLEKNVQEFIGAAKQRIVVKSVIVPAANLISNMFQLVNRGVPVRTVIKGMGGKTAEINAYIKRRAREIDLEADLRVAKGDRNFGRIRQIQTELRSLQDSYRRMSIWPLIEAGEFSAISTGQVTAEDLALADGKWTDWIEQKAASLPGPFSTVARYALITRDTSLYQGLARSVQYGDFIAKAVLYDHLTSRKKVKSEEAIAQVSEAFVNYNRLAGRSRQYLESMGLLWFWNYKLRIMKEAAHTIRNNPVRSLLMSALPPVPIIGDIGLATSDNFLSVLNDGRLGYSIGPSMGLHSFGLNPWINMIR